MPRRKGARLVLGVVAMFLALVSGAIAFLNPRLTRYVEGDRFRIELEKETAKGLHFPGGHYAPIRRIGMLAAATDRFEADHGAKAMRKIDARGIKAAFNPWGFFLRRWQLDEVRIDSGEVQIQIYQPKPEPTPLKPWATQQTID